MTPMVDVVMVILVFFMASAAFIGSDWYLRAGVVAGGKAAPGSSALQAADPFAQRIEVLLDVGPSGQTLVTTLDLSRAPIESFAGRVRAMPRGAASAKIEMVIRPTAPVRYQDVVRVHEACYAAGIEKVGLGTR